ncbi:MAG: DUF6316 family protein [Cellvibrionaceae bacterium]
MRILPNYQGSGATTHSSSEASETRQGEEDKFWFRSDRFFSVGNDWYFTTREHQDVGPFGSRDDAVHGLELFIECVQKQQTSVEHAISVAKQGDWAVVGFH